MHASILQLVQFNVLLNYVLIAFVLLSVKLSIGHMVLVHSY